MLEESPLLPSPPPLSKQIKEESNKQARSIVKQVMSEEFSLIAISYNLGNA
jgi:hypothetical protein